jgi:hypothetical protein
LRLGFTQYTYREESLMVAIPRGFKSVYDACRVFLS